MSPVRRKVRAKESNHTALKNNHIHEMRRRKRDFLTRINYGHLVTVVLVPAFALFALYWFSKPIIPVNTQMIYFTMAYYHLTLLAFTCGYHKFYAHNAFTVRWRWLEYAFVVLGSSLGLGNARWWAALHRAHHHFTDDTEKDPYLIKRGFMWAQWGWLLKKPKRSAFMLEFVEREFPRVQDGISSTPNELENEESASVNELPLNSLSRNVESGPINEVGNDDASITTSEYEISPDFQRDLAVLFWQEKWYYALFLLTVVVIPCIGAFLCGDTLVNGLLYAGLLRMFVCQQQVLSTESVCHMKSVAVTIPSQPFNDKNTSLNCNNWLVSILTYGQAYQNYHHEFPHDYRGTSSIWAFDPTKWLLWLLLCVGAIDNLCRTPENLISQMHVQQQQLVLNRIKNALDWGTPISKLPLVSPQAFRLLVAAPQNKNKIFIVVQNIIHDVTPFMDQHPGGAALLRASHGLDATKAFYGGVYRHLAAASNLLATMRIGMIDLGDDEDVWRRMLKEEDEDEDGDRKVHSTTAEAA